MMTLEFEPIAFLSTLSLRRATRRNIVKTNIRFNFYPRSPCGERQYSITECTCYFYFYPRSPCGERPTQPIVLALMLDFYPRSPCGERHAKSIEHYYNHRISIHALLAESDKRSCKLSPPRIRFLSTLSLRRATKRALAKVLH